jgi:hypothetical protein
MAKRGRKYRRLTIELAPASGDAVEPMDFIRAAKQIEPVVQGGALQGEFTLSVNYSATGSLETASYRGSWRVE